MKRSLLFTGLLSVALTLAAQTTADTALPLTEGTLSYTGDSQSYFTVYYTYTAPADQAKLLEITRVTQSTSVSMSTDGTSSTYVQGLSTSTQNIFPVDAGQTVYVHVSSYQSFEVSVAILDNNSTGGTGCDDAIALPDDGTKVYVPYTGSNYSVATTYLSYTCAEAGVLEMNTVGYVQQSTVMEGCSGTPTSITFSYNSSTGSYGAKVQVEAGVTYIITLAGYSANMIWAQLTHPTEGSSCDMPFVAVDGSNTLPAATGSYWYSYAATTSGYMVLSNENGLPGGSIKVYTSCGSSYATTTVEGYFALRFAVTAGTTYYICVEKAEATGADETFTLAVESAQAGDTYDNPIEIEAGTHNTPVYNGTYYYKVTAPAGGAYIMNVTASGVASSNTRFTVTSASNRYTTLASGSAQGSCEVAGGEAYLITWTCSEGYNAFPFTVSFDAVEQGDVCSDPLPAALGDNSISAATVKYYSYTATLDGYLTVTTDLTTTVTFPMSCATYSGSYSVTTSGMDRRIEVTAGTTYIIKFANVEYDSSFTLAEEPYPAGAKCETALEMTTDSVALPEEVFDLWYQYVAPRDGKVVVSSSILYEMEYTNYRTSTVAMRVGDCTSYSYSATASPTSGYGAVFGDLEYSVAAGDIIYVNVRTVSDQAGKYLKVYVRDAEPGETCANPLEMVAGEMTFPYASSNAPVYYSVQFRKSIKIAAAQYTYFDASLYSDCSMSSALTSTVYDYTTYDYNFEYTVTDATDESELKSYIVVLNRTNSATDVTVTLDGSTAVGKIGADKGFVTVAGNMVTVAPATNNRTDVEIYDVTGRKVEARAVYGTTTINVAQRGIYLVKVGDMVQKIVIR